MNVPDAELLSRYVKEGSEPAFTEIVSRHFDLVYSAALRQVAGDAEAARDVAQSVFTDLAAKARSLRDRSSLAGWLFTSAHHAGCKFVRTEQRRRAREAQALAMQPLEAPSEPDWDRLSPLIDQAMQELNEEEREALLLRYFERRELRTVGMALGVSEEAARKRVGRAVERLRTVFARKGVSLSGGALVAVLTAHAVSAAPAGTLAAVAGAAFASGTATSMSSLSIMNLFTLKTASALTGAAIVAGTVTYFVQEQNVASLRAENQALVAKAQSLGAQFEGAAGDLQLRDQEIARLRKESADLLRLRNEVGQLRRQLASAPKTAAAGSGLAEPQANHDSEEARERDPAWQGFSEMAILKMNHLKQVALAFIIYAGDHGDVLPSHYAEASAYMKGLNQFDTNAYEIAYSGPLQSISNPAQTLLVKEREGMVTPEGKLARAYVFADGHSEVATRATAEEFIAWEAERTFKPSAAATAQTGEGLR